jgi:6-phosphogluconolactonase (cycloisomerase 2 family)
MRLKSRWAVVMLAGLLVVALTGCSNSNNSTTTTTGFMWVATQGDQKLTPYTISLSNGTVTQVAAGVATGINPTTMAITPDAKTLFLADVDDNCASSGAPVYCDRVRSFAVNSDGSLGTAGIPVQITTTSSTTGPLGMALGLAVDPTGTLLFVTHQGNSGVLGQAGSVGGTISVFSISGTTLNPGQLFPSALSGEVTGNGPVAAVASPSGSYLYVADQFTGNVAAYSYDTSGALTFINSYSAGSNPSGLAFSRCAGVAAASTVCQTGADGNILFVANSGSNNVSAFTACIQVNTTCSSPNGTLAQVSGSPFPAGTGPISIIVDPVADFVYALDRSSFQVSQYKFSPATGALSLLSPSSASTGSSPLSGAITLEGNWFFVANNGASSLSAYSVGSTGKLNAATTSSVVLTGQPSAVLIR